MSEKELALRLRALDACAVSDALDRLKINGVALGLRALTSTRRVAGRVITVQLNEDDGRASKQHLGTAALDAAQPGDVIVVAHNGREDVAGWGGILSLGAKQRQVEGIIVDGACRDVDESRELDLPVFARVGVPITARSRIIETGWNEPVAICGVAVQPGDLAIADASGVVFIPAARAEEIIELAETVAAREKLMAQEVLAGKPMAAVMGANYETMLKGKS
jgi:regulator of RNase E activity RraA